MANRWILVFGCLLMLGARPAWPEANDDEIQALREQVRVLTERLDRLERNAQDAGTDSNPVAAASPSASPDAALEQRIAAAVDTQVEQRMAAVAWAERITWSGDFRPRYERIEEEAEDDHDRMRIRARAALQARISDTVRAGFGLASGSADPVSTNQTLGNGGSHKGVTLDLAWFDWMPMEGTTVTGGKYRNPLRAVGGNPLLWDSDWRPEGFAVAFNRPSFFATGIGTWLESDSGSASREFSYALQAGYRLPIGSNTEIMAGAGYTGIDTAGKGAFFSPSNFFDNSFDPDTGVYLYDYHLLEGFTEVALRGLGPPLVLFADYVNNLDTGENDTGYSFGVQFGEVKGRGTWKFGYTYKKLEADAVLGLLTDSDFGGGGTDARGSVIQGAYAFDDNWTFDVTYMINETGLKSGDPSDYDRLQVDLNFKYK